MIFEKGYTIKRVKTSHGSDLYVSKFGQVVKVMPCSPKINISDSYVSNLIRKIESND
jgi:hypothetical protein